VDFVVSATDPWGRPVLTSVSWQALWVSVFIGITFLLAHAAYMVLSVNQKQSESNLDALEAQHTALPDKITRHSLMARLFHWVMAIAMLVLIVTAFFPIMGIQFAWVTWHWIAGVVLTSSILFHIIHTIFWLDFWSIWIGPKDIPDFKNEMLREAGYEVSGPKPGKYPLGNRLYHLILTFVGLGVIGTGLLMLPRIDTPLFDRNPYIFSACSYEPSCFFTESTWGYVYVIHGLVGVSLVGLTIAHIYFAARPEKWWITKAMIVGWIPRRQYLRNHDTTRWRVGPRSTQ